MNNTFLSVREITDKDIEHIAHYWLQAEDSFLSGMGVDLNKLLTKTQWKEMLTEQINTPIDNKKSYCIIWELNGEAIGHSNVNRIIYGEEAYMHLHLWKKDRRKSGYGTKLVRMTLPWFFENLKLKRIFCEPYALNPSPNKTLERAGFRFIKSHITTPGMLNFEQEVNLWEIDPEQYNRTEVSFSE